MVACDPVDALAVVAQPVAPPPAPLALALVVATALWVLVAGGTTVVEGVLAVEPLGPAARLTVVAAVRVGPGTDTDVVVAVTDEAAAAVVVFDRVPGVVDGAVPAVVTAGTEVVGEDCEHGMELVVGGAGVASRAAEPAPAAVSARRTAAVRTWRTTRSP